MMLTMNETNENQSMENTPWYKQPLVWLVIAPPVTAVIAGIITINIAINSDDGLVVDDYYKQGLGINQTLQRDKQAWELQLAANVEVKNNQLKIAFENKQYDTSLNFKFVHPTQSNRDIALNLARTTDGYYVAALPNDVSGNWNLLLEPEDKSWRLMGRMNLPLQQDVKLVPGYSPE